uniref:Small integral membrane protein 5 n=1 Tax=Hippocampus comes TaxID=109280 RepID=A0A3Q2XBV6_HIPCM
MIKMDLKDLKEFGLTKVMQKLQGLPQANPLEIGAFCVIVLFVTTFFTMMIVSCLHCCCCVDTKYQASRVEPLQPI